MTPEELRRIIHLLGAYSCAKFGDEWWPGQADTYLPDPEGAELVALLDRLDGGE